VDRGRIDSKTGIDLSYRPDRSGGEDRDFQNRIFVAQFPHVEADSTTAGWRQDIEIYDFSEPTSSRIRTQLAGHRDLVQVVSPDEFIFLSRPRRQSPHENLCALRHGWRRHLGRVTHFDGLRHDFPSLGGRPRRGWSGICFAEGGKPV